MNLKSKIRNIPDFPKKGILFRDITTLLKDKEAFFYVVEQISSEFSDKGIDIVVAVESRGFILGAPIAYRIGAGFVPVRKKGKLPYKTICEGYTLEYGTDNLEIHKDAIKKGDKVLIVDDLLATGGTVKAVVRLLKRQKAEIVGLAFLVELLDLKGRDEINNYKIMSLVQY